MHLYPLPQRRLSASRRRSNCGRKPAEDRGMQAAVSRLRCCALLLIVFPVSLLFSSQPVSVSARHLPVLPTTSSDQDHRGGEGEPPSSVISSLVRTSCAHARYPSLCLRTLSSSPLPANSTPADLALAAVSASSTSSRDAFVFISSILGKTTSPAPEALEDCREQLRDSSDQLEKTAKELRQLRPETLRWQLDNAQTWASAAMTDQDSCMQGLQGGVRRPGAGGTASAVAAGTRDAVANKVSVVSQLTSNALYLIGGLAPSKDRGRIHSSP